MEVIRNQTTGRYTILLGGEVLTNCSVDADCPGRALCAVNKSWSQYPTMCHCLLTMDHAGAECETVGAYGLFYFVVIVLACIISCLWFLVGLYDVSRMLRWNKLQRDAVSVSLVLAVFALAFTAILAGSTSRFIFQVIVPDSNGSKADNLYVGTIGLIGSFLFSTCALLNISLVWIAVADNVEKMRKHENQSVINKYRKLLLVYYAISVACMIVAVSLGSIMIAAIISTPGVFFVVCTYLIGFVKTRKMSKVFQSADTVPAIGTSASNTPEAMQKIRNSLKAIEYASIGVSIAAINFVVWASCWIALGGLKNEPNAKFNQVAHAMLWFSNVIGIAIVMWYLHGTVRRKGRALAFANDKLLANKKAMKNAVVVVVHEALADDDGVAADEKDNKGNAGDAEYEPDVSHQQTTEVRATAPQGLDPGSSDANATDTRTSGKQVQNDFTSSGPAED